MNNAILLFLLLLFFYVTLSLANVIKIYIENEMRYSRRRRRILQKVRADHYRYLSAEYDPAYMSSGS